MKKKIELRKDRAFANTQRFSNEEMEVLPKGIGLARKNKSFPNLSRFNQENMKVLLRNKSLAPKKKKRFCQEVEVQPGRVESFFQVVEVQAKTYNFFVKR